MPCQVQLWWRHSAIERLELVVEKGQLVWENPVQKSAAQARLLRRTNLFQAARGRLEATIFSCPLKWILPSGNPT